LYLADFEDHYICGIMLGVFMHGLSWTTGFPVGRDSEIRRCSHCPKSKGHVRICPWRWACTTLFHVPEARSPCLEMVLASKQLQIDSLSFGTAAGPTIPATWLENIIYRITRSRCSGNDNPCHGTLNCLDAPIRSRAPDLGRRHHNIFRGSAYCRTGRSHGFWLRLLIGIACGNYRVQRLHNLQCTSKC
jgi:hypothetical protein